MKKFILIDSHALIHRAFHALPPMTTKSGESINAVYGFTSILLKTINEFKPDYIAAAFDLPEPTFRHEEYKEYKATRPEISPDLVSQFSLVKEDLEAFGIPVYEKPGFEADDIIGTIAKELKGKDIEVLILTGDMDTLQLVGGNIKVYMPKRGLTDTVIYDEKQVLSRFEGLKPDQLIDYKGLKGDPSDNIPGVKGIGEKTAITLLNKFGSIEKLYEAVEKGEATKFVSASVLEKLKAGKKEAFFSKKISTINQEVPIDFDLKKSEFSDFDRNKVIELFRKFGFMSLIDRLPSNVEQGALLMPRAEVKKIKYFEAPKDIKIEKLLLELKKAKEIYFSGYGDGNLLISAAIGAGEKIYYVDKKILSCLGDIFSNPKIKKIGNDFKVLVKTLASNDIDAGGLDFDTTIAAYVINPGERDYGLARLVLKEFGEELLEIFKENQKDALALQVSFIQRLYPIYKARLEATKTAEVFEEIEMPLIPVLAKMEMLGIELNGKKLNELSRVIDRELKKREMDIYDLAGEKFNISSPQQLSEILFVKLKIPGARAGGRIKKTRGGALSTEAGELERLRHHHKIIDHILRYRELAKIKSTYVDTLPALVDRNNRIHTTFNQTGTATGRLSSQNPNMQNIPARGSFGDEIRKSFVTAKGFDMLSCDYSQIHLRIVAALSGDKKMIQAFEKGLDIHKFTASIVNGVPMDKVTPEMRFAAKELNFGIIYGMGVQSFSEAAHISRDRAEEFMNDYRKEFSGVAAYLEKLKLDAAKNGYAVTEFGRRRYLPEIHSPNFQLRSLAERIAVNMPIQGLEADIMKKAMIEIGGWIKKEKLENDLRLLLQVHDELVFESKIGLARKVAPKILELMRGVIKLKVPILAEAKAGKNWGELRAISDIVF